MAVRFIPLVAVLAGILVVPPSPAAAAPIAAEGFERSALLRTVEGRADLRTAVACFSAKARLPSFAHVATYAEAGEAMYRLRFDGLMFESIRFVPTDSGGTRAEIRLASTLTRDERAHFETARGAPLAACLNRPVARTGTPVADAGL